MRRSNETRLSLPSKGRLADSAVAFLAACGLEIDKPNPRQYAASIPTLPGLTVLFQRPGDIVVGVRDGSVDFGITGLDVVEEHRGEGSSILVLHDALGFGHCRLCLAIPEQWDEALAVEDLPRSCPGHRRSLRVATKFPKLTGDFLAERNVPHTLVYAEGALEAAPAIGYADAISDLVSSGQTLRDNRLRVLPDATIMWSQAALVANRGTLQQRETVLSVARELLEIIEAHLRARECLSVVANMRGESPTAIAERMFACASLGGLQGPTISPVINRSDESSWYAVHIIVRRDQLFQTVADLRAIGGSGVVVTPVKYIFEEEPPRYKAMMEALSGGEPRDADL
jgi:ATP phosphoribosyltransferase